MEEGREGGGRKEGRKKGSGKEGSKGDRKGKKNHATAATAIFPRYVVIL